MAKIGVNHLVNHLLFQKTLPEKEIFPLKSSPAKTWIPTSPPGFIETPKHQNPHR